MCNVGEREWRGKAWKEQRRKTDFFVQSFLYLVGTQEDPTKGEKKIKRKRHDFSLEGNSQLSGVQSKHCFDQKKHCCQPHSVIDSLILSVFINLPNENVSQVI